jgi:hypothetical protein
VGSTVKCRPKILIGFLLIFALASTACTLASHLVSRQAENGRPRATRPRQFLALATFTSTPFAAPVNEASAAENIAQQPAVTPASSADVVPAAIVEGNRANLDPITSNETPLDSANSNPVATDPLPQGQPTLAPLSTRRPTRTPTPGTIAGLTEGELDLIGAASPTPTRTRVPTWTATPTPTSTSTPTETPTPTNTPTETATPSPTPLPTNTPLPTDTPSPTPLPTRPPPPPPTATPLPTVPPPPEYDFLLGEFFNSPTTNSFMVIYVAIVDINEVPIGGMKIIGTRLDHNLTYESLLSTWHYEGYNAPGEVVKSGNVKFEPPGGIESISWKLYLADANGAQMSETVQFDTNQNDKQWYFITFRRKF